MTRVCLICGKEIKPAFSGDDNLFHPPLGALYLRTWGNYGSKFDPLNENLSLEAYVCDSCLDKRAKRFKLCVRGKDQSTETLEDYFKDEFHD